MKEKIKNIILFLFLIFGIYLITFEIEFTKNIIQTGIEIMHEYYDDITKGNKKLIANLTIKK